jgi:hypothetical protein
MPNSIDICDLVQDGVLGLIDAARFDEDREPSSRPLPSGRVRGAMIDALRKDAWPRVRRQRRELDAAREALRRDLGHEPSMADSLPASDPTRSASAAPSSASTRLPRRCLATGEHMDESLPPTVPVPSEPDSRHAAYEKAETRDASAGAIQALLARAQGDRPYYYGEVTMADWRRHRRQRIARLAVARPRDPPAARLAGRHESAAGRRDAPSLIAFTVRKPTMAKAAIKPIVHDGTMVAEGRDAGGRASYKPANKRPAVVKAALDASAPKLAVAR